MDGVTTTLTIPKKLLISATGSHYCSMKISGFGREREMDWEELEGGETERDTGLEHSIFLPHVTAACSKYARLSTLTRKIINLSKMLVRRIGLLWRRNSLTNEKMRSMHCTALLVQQLTSIELCRIELTNN